MSIEHLQYPIGKPVREPLSETNKERAIQTIVSFPKKMREICSNLSEEELDEPYRPGGWTKRQVVHHCADSHMNAYIRFKLALTEETPTIKPYDEGAWAAMADYQEYIGSSLQLLDALHEKWAKVLRNMTEEDWDKQYYHPENDVQSSMGENLLHYEWHCKHHLGHMQI